MPGPFPKLPEQRRNRTKPARGEWIDLPPLQTPVIPEESRSWSPNARRAWRAWRADRVSALWGPADLHFARELARLYDDLPPNEVRLRMDSLGLTPHGRQSLRWRVSVEAKTDGEQPAPVRRLRLTERQDSASADAARSAPDSGS